MPMDDGLAEVAAAAVAEEVKLKELQAMKAPHTEEKVVSEKPFRKCKRKDIDVQGASSLQGTSESAQSFKVGRFEAQNKQQYNPPTIERKPAQEQKNDPSNAQPLKPLVQPLDKPIKREPREEPFITPIKREPREEPINRPIKKEPGEAPINKPIKKEPLEEPVNKPIKKEPLEEPISTPIKREPLEEPINQPIKREPAKGVTSVSPVQSGNFGAKPDCSLDKPASPGSLSAEHEEASAGHPESHGAGIPESPVKATSGGPESEKPALLSQAKVMSSNRAGSPGVRVQAQGWQRQWKKGKGGWTMSHLVRSQSRTSVAQDGLKVAAKARGAQVKEVRSLSTRPPQPRPRLKPSRWPKPRRRRRL